MAIRRGVKRFAMRIMFWTYLIIIVAGLAYYWYVGLSHG